MPDKPHRQRPTPDQFAEARRAYEKGEPMLAIAKRLNVHRTTLIRRSVQENWQSPALPPSKAGTQAIQQRVESNIIDFATHKAIEEFGETVIESAREDLSQHFEIGKLCRVAVINTLNAYNNGEIQPGDRQNIGDVLNSLLTAANRAQAMERTSHGLKPGQPSVGEPPETKQRRIVFTVVAPPKSA